MANPKLETVVDAFTAPALNTALWGATTPGVATLDTVNAEVSLAVPTTSGAINSVATTAGALYDATGSYVYAQVRPAANGAGHVRTAIRIRYDDSNAATIRLENGVFQFTAQTVTTTTLTLPNYDPHAHRWWRLREAGGSFYAGTSPDGLTWTEWGPLGYGFDATNVTLRLETAATATELAGNAAVFSHVNTRAGGPLNPNWPGMEDAWGPFWNANAGSSPQDRFVDVTDRTRGSVSVQRGRQYELDQVRSGEASLTLANTDAALDPVNDAGPWAGHIAPYQPYRKRAQWPPTRNLADPLLATGGDAGQVGGTISPSTTEIFSDTDTTGGSFVTATDAWLGDTVLQFAVPAGATAPTRIMHWPRLAVTPGRTYTIQMRVRNVTASTSVNVQPHFGWYAAGTTTTPNSYTYGTTSTLTGATSASWTTLTLTATAPANAAGIDLGVTLATTPAAAASVQVDGVQVEEGAVATAWTCPGAWYPLYAGFTERWPSTWDMQGLYGLVEPTAVDAFSLLSQQQLNDALTMELNSYTPRFVYKLDEPAGSLSMADWTGNNPGVQIGIGKYGAGSITLGNSVTANDPDRAYTGSTGTVATVNNSNPGTGLVTGGASFVKLGSAGILGPADLSQWTRMIAFRYTGPTTIAARVVLWSAFSRTRTNNNPGGSQMWFWIDSDGYFRASLGGPASGGWFSFKAQNPLVNDGDWHLALVSYDRNGQKLNIRVDEWYWQWTNIGGDLEPSGLVSDNVGCWVDPTVGNGTTYNFKGDLSFIAEFPTALTPPQMYQIYTAWRNNCAGESSDSRYARILRYAGYTGGKNIQPGLTTAMGPANIEGQDAMSALQTVVDTENGAHYFDATGSITFKSRSSRYNASSPVYTFGERVDLGELPYEDCQLDFDSTHLSNQVTVTQEGTSQNFYASDDASVTSYFPRTMSRTINAQDPNECQDAASYLLSRYRQPATRVSSLKLHPSAVPALWPVCLGLELGTRIRVIRRPPGAPAVQVECYVENIAWEFSDDGEAWLTLQCSPADLTSYGVFAAWHTTLATAPAVGTKTLTVNAPQVTQIYNSSFATAGTWQVVGGNAAIGPITTALDGSTTAAKATTYTILEDSVSIPYDPTTTYRVSATIRTATAPTSGTPTIYVGLTGIDANGNRVNINGANSLTSQIYCAARATQAPSTYTTYTGYVSGTSTPGGAGANTDPSNPEKVRPEIVAVRPLVYLLYNCTDGVQYVDSFTIHTVPTNGGIPLASQLAPGQQLTLGQGTANAETVTVSAVGATSPGWTTATITTTAATTKSHTAGDVVSEPLPTGKTDPTTWDATAAFDSIAFAY